MVEVRSSINNLTEAFESVSKRIPEESFSNVAAIKSSLLFYIQLNDSEQWAHDRPN